MLLPASLVLFFLLSVFYFRGRPTRTSPSKLNFVYTLQGGKMFIPVGPEGGSQVQSQMGYAFPSLSLHSPFSDWEKANTFSIGGWRLSLFSVLAFASRIQPFVSTVNHPSFVPLLCMHAGYSRH